MKVRQFTSPSLAVSAILLAVLLFLTGSAAAAQSPRSLTPLTNASIEIEAGTSPNSISTAKVSHKTSSRRGISNEKTMSSSGSSTIVVVSTSDWVNTGVQLNLGDHLAVTATGQWTPYAAGEPMVGPDGGKPWWDTYLNLTDIGLCVTCTPKTDSPHWAALIGYIGNAPPAPGSYTSVAILPEAQKVFLVGSSLVTDTVYSGTLWLGFNDDAYSGSTGDNAGQVTAVITGLPTYSISGQVIDSSNAPFVGANISDGWGDTTTTDSNGNYTFGGLLARTYTLTPSLGGYAFTPASRSVNVPPDGTGQDFIASPILPTTTTVTSSVNPSIAGQPVAFTATVASTSGIPAGQVTFKDAGSGIGTVNLNNAGAATLTTSTLSAGSHTITAEYSGATTFYGSSSNPLTQRVRYGTTTVLAGAPNPSFSKQQITLTANVASGGGTPTGAVSFMEGATVLSTVNLDGSGVATFVTSGLAWGLHSLSANYLGDTLFADGTSPVIAQTVENEELGIKFNGWRGVIDAKTNGGTYRMSKTKYDTATFKFTGTSVTWVTRKGPDQGKAQVLVDGVSKGTFDLYSATVQRNVPKLFKGLTNKPHTLIIKVLGTKNIKASSTNVTVDAFIVSSKTTQDDSSSIQYDTWVGVSALNASGGSYRSSKASNAVASFAFNGMSVDWITAMGPAYGKAKVFIDGLFRETIDLYSPTQQWQWVKSYSVPIAGTHTIQIKALGTKNGASKSTMVVVDGFGGPITTAGTFLPVGPEPDVSE
jgi:hypothetical protein